MELISLLVWLAVFFLGVPLVVVPRSDVPIWLWTGSFVACIVVGIAALALISEAAMTWWFIIAIVIHIWLAIYTIHVIRHE